MPQQSRLLLRTALLLCLPLVTLCAPRAFGQTSGSASDAVYIAAFRTSAHVNRSSAQIFRELVDEVLDRLKDKRVPIAKDPSRPMIRSEEAMPVPTLVNAAKDSGASSLLVLTVDRPATSWLKLSVQAYDLAGMLLWEEHASYGGGLNGNKAVSEVVEKISKQLGPRLGKPGLPVAP